jgi:hypothetical protein
MLLQRKTKQKKEKSKRKTLQRPNTIRASSAFHANACKETEKQILLAMSTADRINADCQLSQPNQYG